jgi:DNA repair protein SbcC/Rad50
MSKKEIKIKNLLYNNNEPVKYIFQLADIHIRLDIRRHKEYNLVFERLYEYLKKQKKGIVVVCGDILHSKNELSPEVVQMTINFFKNLGNIMDVFIIMGNHDVNLSNKNKLDSLTPLLAEINSKNNIHYLKDTGIYNYKNITFSVVSILDNQFIKASDVETSNLKIALFHGAVHGAETDVGHRMNDTEYVVKDFDGYDYVLLGDIHKFQYLDENKRICYSSSLIQQSYGEKMDYHGLVKWNLKKEKSCFINIKNDYGFLTIKVKNGKLSEIPDNMPLKPRIRLLLENTNRYQYVKLCDELKSKYDIQEITSSFITNKKEGDNIKEDTNIKIKIDNVKYQNSLMKKYINKNFNMNKKKRKKILKLNKEINSIVEKKEVINSNKWRLKYLKFSNMFSYGEDNYINFDKLKGIVGLFAPNFYGKSSILDIIQFCLFDRCSRGIRTEILNYKKQSLACELTLEINGVDYKIIREGKKKKNHAKTIRIDVWFWKINESEKDWVLLNGKDRHETNKLIAKYIGTYEDFIMTSLKLQKDMNFIDYPQCKKKDFLIKLLKLNIFEDLSKVSKDRLKEILAVYNDLMFEVKKVNYDDKLKELDKYRNLLEEKLESKNHNNRLIRSFYKDINKSSLKIKNVDNKNLKDILKLEKEIDIYKYDYESIKNELTELKEKESNFLTKIKDLKDMFSLKRQNEIINNYENKKEKNNLEKKNLNDKIKELYLKIKSNVKNDNNFDNLIKKKNKVLSNLDNHNSNICKIKNNLNDIEKKIILIDNKETIIKNFQDFSKNNNNLNDFNNLLEKYDSKLIVMKDKLNKLSDHKYDPNCTFCINNIFVKDARNTRLKHNLLTVKKFKLIINRDKIKREVILNLKHENKYNYLYKTENLNNTYKQESYELKNDLNDLEKNILINNNYLEKYNNDINIYNRNEELIKNNKDINNKIKNLNKELLLIENFKDDNYEKVLDNKEKLKNIELLQKDLIFNISQKENKELELKHKIQSLEKEIKLNNEIKEQLLINNKLNLTILSLNKKIESVSKDLNNDENILQELENKISILKNVLSNLEEKSKKLKKLENEKYILSNYLKIISKDGLPYELLSNIIPTIENIANTILLPVSNFTISIELVKSDINVYKIDDKYKGIISLCSGYEQFIIALSIRIALTQINNQSFSSFIAIDEGLSCMDSNNLNNLSSLFDFLRDKFDFVLLMSHIQEIKGECDNILNITKKNKFSNINFT